MSGEGFDQLSKTLATSTSRRKFFKVAAAAAAAGVLSAVGAPEAYAARKCREIGQPCQSDAQCCTRYCDNSSFRCACPGTVCNNGQCLVCEAPKVVNATACTCDCPANTACTGSGGTVNQNTCECDCPGGRVLSGGQCVCLPVTCPTGQIQNPTTCRCECATTPVTCGSVTCACGEICCPAGTRQAGKCRGNINACRE